MMRKYFTVLLLLGAVSVFFAQRYSTMQRKKDSLRLDSLCNKNPAQCSDYAELIGVNSIFRNLEKAELKPKETNCFNKKIHYQGIVNHKPVEGCYYVNTESGLVAKFANREMSCESLTAYRPNTELEMFSMRGDSFLYTINEKGFKYFRAIPFNTVNDGLSTHFVVKSKSSLENHLYTKLSDHQYPTLKYSIQESSSGATYSLFAPVFESIIPVKNYLGAFGTGYYENQYGNTIISLLMDSDSENYIAIQKIVDVAECFNGSSFENEIEQAVNNENEIYQKKEETIEKERENGSRVNYPCPARNELVALKKEMNRKEKDVYQTINNSNGRYSPEQLDQFSRGNDVIDQANKLKLELEIKICDLNYSNTLKLSEQYKAVNYRKISCLQNSISQLNKLIIELKEIDHRTPNPATRMVEKNRFYMQEIKNIDLGCVVDNHGNIKGIPKANDINKPHK